jgi:hypothetical protein
MPLTARRGRGDRDPGEGVCQHDLAHRQKVLEDEPGVWGALATPRETLNDPRVEPNGYVVMNVDDQGEKYRIVAALVHFNETPPAPAPAPEHGFAQAVYAADTDAPTPLSDVDTSQIVLSGPDKAGIGAEQRGRPQPLSHHIHRVARGGDVY